MKYLQLSTAVRIIIKNWIKKQPNFEGIFRVEVFYNDEKKSVQ